MFVKSDIFTSVATILVIVVACVSFTGCGGNDGRIALNGTVSVDGELVDKGSINFVPVSGTSSPVAAGPVDCGCFSIPGHKGVKPGSFKITFRLPVEMPKNAAPDKPVDPSNFNLGAAVKKAMENAPDVPPTFSLEVAIDANPGELDLQFTSEEE